MMDIATPASPDDAAEDDRIADAVTGQRLPGGKALNILAVLGVLYTLYFAAAIVLPFVLAMVLFLLLSPVMRVLCRRLHFPRPLSALLVILLLFLVVAGVGAAISVPASGWIAKAPESLPMLEQKLGFLSEPISFLQKSMEQINQFLQRHSGPLTSETSAAVPPAPQT